MRNYLIATVVILIGCTAAAHADLVDAFVGFQTIEEIDVSGLVSTYHTDTVAGHPVAGATTGNVLPVFGPERVSYPNGIGQVPSPGGALGRDYDMGVLGYRLDGTDLVFQMATAIDPQLGRYHDGWGTWYGVGDLFLSVEDSAGMRHYALLNTWARDDQGQPVSINRGHYDAAKTFHTEGNTGRSSLEGHLIGLSTDSDVSLSGGRGAYNTSNAPAGLDLRVYAKAGTDLGDAGLVHSSLSDAGRTWYIQQWRVGVGNLSSDADFDLALHAEVSCGNDQIGGRFGVPEPSPALAMLAIAGLIFRRRGNW